MTTAAIPAQVRAIASASLVKPEDRTVEVVFATETPVRRRRYEGWDRVVDFDEVLTVSRAAIDLERFASGAPALDSHARYSTSAQVGVVEKAWIDGKDARALIRFPKAGIDEKADRLFGLIEDGIVRNVSVGYRLLKIKVIEPEKRGEIQKVIALRWEPFEISFVTVPADPKSGVRGDDADLAQAVELDGNNAVAAAAARMRMRQASFA